MVRRDAGGGESDLDLEALRVQHMLMRRNTEDKQHKAMKQVIGGKPLFYSCSTSLEVCFYKCVLAKGRSKVTSTLVFRLKTYNFTPSIHAIPRHLEMLVTLFVLLVVFQSGRAETMTQTSMFPS